MITTSRIAQNTETQPAAETSTEAVATVKLDDVTGGWWGGPGPYGGAWGGPWGGSPWGGGWGGPYNPARAAAFEQRRNAWFAANPPAAPRWNPWWGY